MRVEFTPFVLCGGTEIYCSIWASAIETRTVPNSTTTNINASQIQKLPKYNWPLCFFAPALTLGLGFAMINFAWWLVKVSRSHVENRRINRFETGCFHEKTPFFLTMIPCTLTLKRGRSLRKESRMIMLFTCMSFLFISSFFLKAWICASSKKNWKSKVKTDTGSHFARTTVSRFQHSKHQKCKVVWNSWSPPNWVPPSRFPLKVGLKHFLVKTRNF